MTDERPPGDPTAPVVEDTTQPWRLRDIASRLAQRRRRSLGAELTFKRGRTDVRVPLERTETVIGRDTSCDIVLVERTVSARHARVVRGAGGYFEIEDLASTNGVIVEHEPVRRMTLQDGDSFVVGETRFTIVIAPVVGDGG